MPTSIARSASGLAMALAMCGCQPDAVELRDIAAPRLGVATTRQVYDIPPGACFRVKSAVQRFIETAADGRPESLRVSIEVPRSPACGRLIASAVEDAGVPRSHVLLSTGQAAPSFREAARIVADRLVAGPAECYVSTAPNYISPNDNGFDPALGCSTLADVGRMVADPEDLHFGNRRIKAEGEPAASAVAAERQRRDVAPAPPSSQDHVRTTASP